MDMRPVDPALYRCPEPFNAVCAGTLKADVFVSRMIDRHVAMPARVKPKIGPQFVSMDRAARNDVGVDKRGERRLALVWKNVASLRRHRVPASPSRPS